MPVILLRERWGRAGMHRDTFGVILTHASMLWVSEWSHSVVSDSVTPWTVSLPGSSVHGIFQARILEWVAISFSKACCDYPIFWTTCLNEWHFGVLCQLGASLVAWSVKNLLTVQETWVWSLGREDPLEKQMANQSRILAWKIPWTEKPGRLRFMRSQRVRHDWVTNAVTFLPASHFHLSIGFKWVQPTPESYIMVARN